MSFISLSLLIVSSALLNYVTVDAILKPQLKGPGVTPVFSPFDKDGQVDLAAIRPYAAYLFKNRIRDVHLFKPIAGEPFSVNLCESKNIIREWLRVNRENGYGFTFIVGLSFLTARDSCDLAAFCEKNNIDAVSFRPQSDAGPRNDTEAAEDLRYIAECAPSTPIFLLYGQYFRQCAPFPNIGITHSIAIASISNYAGIIAPIEQCSLARAYDNKKAALYILSYIYFVNPAERNTFDYLSTVLSNIVPTLTNQIENSRSYNATIAYRDELNNIGIGLCNLRRDCRLPCAMNILKAAFRLVSGIDLYPRPPLCDITPGDVSSTRKILRQEGFKLIN